MTPLFIGVDGGGSKTTAIVADESGNSLAEAVGAASAVRSGGVEASADAIAQVVETALARLDSADTPRVLCVGVAGVAREHVRRELLEMLVARDLAEDVLVHTDFDIAFADAFGEGPGILIIAGTGSVAVGRGPTGAVGRAGGWGPNLGDEGGGAWLGRRALSVVTAAADGREPDTALTGAILTATECGDATELIAWATDATPQTLAALAPIVAQVAASGDLRANALLDMATEELVLHARALARQLFVDERAAVPIALSGGLLAGGRPLRKRLQQRLKTAVPGAQLHQEEVVPARGAIRMAQELVGDSAGG